MIGETLDILYVLSIVTNSCYYFQWLFFRAHRICIRELLSWMYNINQRIMQKI